MIIQFSGLRHISKNEWTDVEHWAERHVGGPLPRIFTAKNTNGFQAGACYEYTNKKGYTFSSGLLFGLEQQDYHWDFSFKYFDSTLDMSNVKLTHDYKFRRPYVGLSLSAGHNYYPFKTRKWSVNAKAGLNYIRYLKDDYQNYQHLIIYSKEEGADSVFIKHFATTEIINYKSSIYYDLYLGMKYATGGRLIKECRLGLSFIHSFAFFRRNQDYNGSAHAYYYNSKGEWLGGDVYLNRFRNVAVTLGFAL